MISSSAILLEKYGQADPLIDGIQDMILDYVAGDIAESKSIYTTENRCTLFDSGAQDKSYNKLEFHYLLHHIVRGEQSAAQAIIEADPELLFKSGNVGDLSGNTFVGFSPVELARFAHDVEMLEMMKPYADKIEGGTEKFIVILQEAFKYEEAKKQEVYDFSRVITAITSDAKEARTDALNQFRQTFAPRVIEHSEKSYNLKNLRKAYEVYENHHVGWSVDRSSLFWRQVIGFLQRSLPACYAQAFCQGFHGVVVCGEALKRRLKRFGGESFYPADLSVSQGLGFDFGADSTVTALFSGGRLSLYIKQKQQRCEILCNSQVIESRSVVAQ